MNDADVLPRYIPEFGELVAFFQHNVYHYYTADEHTLIAVANAEALREKQGILREVFRNLRRKDILYAGRSSCTTSRSPAGWRTMRSPASRCPRAILHRLGMEEIARRRRSSSATTWSMEQMAFRRNIHDPATLREFAARFRATRSCSTTSTC